MTNNDTTAPAPRKLMIIGWDGNSKPMYRYADERGLPDYMRTSPSPEEIAAAHDN